MRYEFLFMWIYKGERGCLSSISVSFRATRDPRLSVTGLQMEKRKTHPPLSPPESSRNLQSAEAIEQTRGSVLTLIWIERLSWSILHGPLALRTNSPRAIGRGEMRFFLHWGIYGSVRTTYAPPRSRWREMMGPLRGDTIARYFFVLGIVVLGLIHKSNAASY